MFTAFRRRPDRPRRGVTLVEMMVVVALVVLMMVILVQIFQQALGAMSASRTTQELDVVLRQVDSMLRSDLSGVTAKMTPPNDPALKQGYFEYGEGAPADLHGEDTDDFLSFTTKAREGQSFSGRQFLIGTATNPVNPNIQPITITSQVAEVIYFLRNGNLYRRVFLVAPERSKSLTVGTAGVGKNYATSIFGGSLLVSWQGMNDISCRPGGFDGAGRPQNPIPNDLGDLTNREKRAFRPRFIDDLNPQDGIPDDNNSDGVNDYYPTLYYNGSGGHAYKDANNNPVWSPNAATSEISGFPNVGRVEQGTNNSVDVYAFPFIYPGMYSVPDPNRASNGLGSLHYLPPNATSGYINHSPLDIGDTPNFAPGGNQTWWGFPTWRETMAGVGSGGIGWTDPILFVGLGGTNRQPNGLRPYPPTVIPTTYNNANLLPPVHQAGTATVPFGYDNVGSASFVALPAAPNHLWEDDLILTNVRSFDVKAYDPDAPLYNTAANGLFSAGYQDLGYGAASYAGGWLSNGGNPVTPPWQANGEPQGFGHEGRMPSIPNDFRHDPRRGFLIGDNSSAIVRLLHTFDTWSTAYTKAPDTDILLNGNPSSGNPNPIYPAFPAPYPSALRGIQIQIRVVDPRNERSKVLTIRHDFTDKLTN